MLVEKRETRYRVMWYYRLFEETQRGLTRYPNSLEHIHGSLLALGELLRHTGVQLCPPKQHLEQAVSLTSFPFGRASGSLVLLSSVPSHIDVAKASDALGKAACKRNHH